MFTMQSAYIGTCLTRQSAGVKLRVSDGVRTFGLAKNALGGCAADRRTLEIHPNTRAKLIDGFFFQTGVRTGQTNLLAMRQ